MKETSIFLLNIRLNYARCIPIAFSKFSVPDNLDPNLSTNAESLLYDSF